jgi:ATP-dependent DNA helicase PIF1
MQRLHTEEVRFQAFDGGTLKGTEQGIKMLSNFMAPKELCLRVDAQVMLIKNVDEQLVNGTMGRVKRFIDPANYATETGHDISNGVGATNAIPKRSANIYRHPEVEFSLPSGSKRTVLVTQETWKVELPNGEIQVSRTQVLLPSCYFLRLSRSDGLPCSFH